MSPKIDPKDVRFGWNKSSSVARPGRGPTRGGGPARQKVTLILTHVPTGTTVSKEAVGPFTRAQMRNARSRLTKELWPELEAAVTKDQAT